MVNHPTSLLKPLRRLYSICGYLAGACILAMQLVILIQIVMRWGGASFGGATSIAGYLMGTATFFALAYTFDKKGHIRVELLLESSGRLRPFLESFSLLAAVAIAAFITWHGYDSAYWAYTYGDKSSGQDATPLWIPQALISTGALVFTICLVDYFCRSLVNLFKPLRWGAGAKPVRSH